MDGLIAAWAGEERLFRLRFGDLMDLEEACGRVGVGELYLRLTQHRFFVREVYHTIRLGLVGGGMAEPEVHRLMQDRFDATPMAARLELAVGIILSTWDGIDPEKGKAGATGKPDPTKPIDKGQALHALAQLGLSPEQVRAMRFADFVALVRGAGRGDLAPPSEAEFEDMVRRLAPEVPVEMGGV